ncbi:MAG: FkbM family methyltransferase [Aphanizomenon flos-aquae Clear-A1]|nr:FkbM family methyltransferase [Aphanizomenon flos-aquae Clear-A1]
MSDIAPISDELKQHLTHLSANPGGLPEAHKDYLRNLKASGFEPKVIYDIGACVLHWTKFAQELWPEAEIILFDAFQPAEFLYPPHRYNIGVLSDQDNKEVKFYQNDMLPGGNSYYREIGCQGGRFFPEDSYKVMYTRTLDSLVQERGYPLPDLVKIDVQGAEKDVISGAQHALSQTKHLIVEMQHVEYNQGAPKVDETLPFIESKGFKCVAPLFANNGPDGDYGFIRTGTSTF